MEEEKCDEQGLSTNFRPKSKSEMKGSDQLESFITQLQRELVSIGWNTKITEKKDKYQEMRRLLQSLEESEIVMVPNDKTNSFRITRERKYKTMVEEHLIKPAKDIERGNTVDI